MKLFLVSTFYFHCHYNPAGRRTTFDYTILQLYIRLQFYREEAYMFVYVKCKSKTLNKINIIFNALQYYELPI